MRARLRARVRMRVRARIRLRIHDTNHILIDIRWEKIDDSQRALWVKKNTGSNQENNDNANDRNGGSIHLQGGIGFIRDSHGGLHSAQHDTRVAKKVNRGDPP
jgi:hypothetical protein